MPDLLDPDRISDLQQLYRSVPNYSIQLLVAEFFKSTETLILQIELSENQIDASKMQSLLHALKGASMTIGAAQLLELSKKAEGVCKEKALSDLPDLVQKISDVYKKTKVALLALS